MIRYSWPIHSYLSKHIPGQIDQSPKNVVAEASGAPCPAAYLNEHGLGALLRYETPEELGLDTADRSVSDGAAAAKLSDPQPCTQKEDAIYALRKRMESHADKYLKQGEHARNLLMTRFTFMNQEGQEILPSLTLGTFVSGEKSSSHNPPKILLSPPATSPNGQIKIFLSPHPDASPFCTSVPPPGPGFDISQPPDHMAIGIQNQRRSHHESSGNCKYAVALAPQTLYFLPSNRAVRGAHQAASGTPGASICLYSGLPS